MFSACPSVTVRVVTQAANTDGKERYIYGVSVLNASKHKVFTGYSFHNPPKSIIHMYTLKVDLEILRRGAGGT